MLVALFVAFGIHPTNVHLQPAVTPEDLQAHITTLLSKIHMNMLVVGNFYKDVSTVKSLTPVS